MRVELCEFFGQNAVQGLEYFCFGAVAAYFSVPRLLCTVLPSTPRCMVEAVTVLLLSRPALNVGGAKQALESSYIWHLVLLCHPTTMFSMSFNIDHS